MNTISDRIMVVRMDTKEGYWTVLTVYAPQSGCSETEKDEFYLTLDEAIRSVPEEDYLTIAGDLNGHVGKDRMGLERVHGGQGIGTKNAEGGRILDLAAAHDLAICSTFFAKRRTQKVTYSSGGRQTEIDHVLVIRSSLKTVKDIGTAWGRAGPSAQAFPGRHRHRPSQEDEGESRAENSVVENGQGRKG